MSVEITDANFEELVLKSDKPVLIDFWAEWCGPCKMIAPAIDELSKEYEGRAVLGKFNVDENPKVSVEYGVMNMPTFLVFKQGKLVNKQVGAVPKHHLSKLIDAQLV